MDIHARALSRSVTFNAFEKHLPPEMIVFGAGGRGRLARLRLEALGVRVTAFADNDASRHGQILDGLPILAPASLRDCSTPVIICSWGVESIEPQLTGLGVRRIYRDSVANVSEAGILDANRDKVEAVLAALADRASREMYLAALRLRFQDQRMTYYSPYPMYAHPLVKGRPGDLIVDGGASYGDTLALFRRQCGDDCVVHLFEPTPAACRWLSRTLAERGLTGAHVVRKALWSATTTVSLRQEAMTSASNHVSVEGGLTVEAVSLDDYVRDNGIGRIDLIKLDIEGAELAALEGAARTIRRDRPRLQICLYHKDDDLWDIPLYVRSLVPEYKMYIGHHSCTFLDTVLYCAV